jgi:hypothetical protein
VDLFEVFQSMSRDAQRRDGSSRVTNQQYLFFSSFYIRERERERERVF